MAHSCLTQPTRRPASLLLCCIAAAMAMLTACGGSSDDERSASVVLGTSAEQPPALESGALAVPAAPTLGDVLVEDALSLRPLADEAMWVYRGARSANAQTTHYSSFTQVSKTSTGFEERSSNPWSGNSARRQLRMEADRITAEESLELATGSTTVRAIELRSPVRQGDQHTLGEAQGVTLAEDIDRDGKPDTLDWAAWSRVIALESVELPELERSVRAVRVDVTVVSRVRRSGQTQPDARSTWVESRWYAAGIGVVRVARKRLAADGAETTERDERLQYWDGITQGLGLQPSGPVSVAGSTASIGPWLALPRGVVARGDLVFVLTDAPSGSRQSVVLSVLDKRGRVAHSVEHAGVMSADQTAPQLIPLGDGVATVRRELGALLYAEQLENFKLSRFDTQAQRLGRDVWLVDGAVAGSLKAASDGETVWVSWLDAASVGASRRLMLQAFDALGEVKSRVHVLEAPGPGVDLRAVELSAQSGRVSVSWQSQSNDVVHWRVAVGGVGQLPAVTTLLSTTRSSSPGAARLRPLMASELTAVSWSLPLEATGGAAAPRAVALDAGAQPRRSRSGSLDQELLPVPTAALQAEERMLTGAEGKRLVWAAAGSERLRGDTETTDRLLSFATLDSGDAALAAAVPSLRRLRDSSPASTWQGTVRSLHSIVPMDDRWIVVGHDGTHTTLAVLYRR